MQNQWKLFDVEVQSYILDDLNREYCRFAGGPSLRICLPPGTVLTASKSMFMP
jgi:hypothetical protein